MAFVDRAGTRQEWKVVQRNWENAGDRFAATARHYLEIAEGSIMIENHRELVAVAEIASLARRRAGVLNALRIDLMAQVDVSEAQFLCVLRWWVAVEVGLEPAHRGVALVDEFSRRAARHIVDRGVVI